MGFEVLTQEAPEKKRAPENENKDKYGPVQVRPFVALGE